MPLNLNGVPANEAFFPPCSNSWLGWGRPSLEKTGDASLKTCFKAPPPLSCRPLRCWFTTPRTSCSLSRRRFEKLRLPQLRSEQMLDSLFVGSEKHPGTSKKKRTPPPKCCPFLWNPLQRELCKQPDGAAKIKTSLLKPHFKGFNGMLSYLWYLTSPRLFSKTTTTFFPCFWGFLNMCFHEHYHFSRVPLPRYLPVVSMRGNTVYEGFTLVGIETLGHSRPT